MPIKWFRQIFKYVYQISVTFTIYSISLNNIFVHLYLHNIYIVCIRLQVARRTYVEITQIESIGIENSYGELAIGKHRKSSCANLPLIAVQLYSTSFKMRQTEKRWAIRKKWFPGTTNKETTHDKGRTTFTRYQAAEHFKCFLYKHRGNYRFSIDV